jgi:hypothetical protein
VVTLPTPVMEVLGSKLRFCGVLQPVLTNVEQRLHHDCSLPHIS